MSGAIEISVVVPVYRSAATLRELVARLDAVLRAERAEYLFAVDASPDDSVQRLAALQRERSSGPALRVLVGARNVGQHAALREGFRAARGRALIVLDADLQYAPEELPRLVAAWRSGAELVAGYRARRADSFVARVLPSALFNAFARVWSGVPLRDFGCGFCLLDARLVPELERAGARRRFLKPLLGALARRTVELAVESAPRSTPSAYGFAKLARLAAAFAVGWSARPFAALAILGLLALVSGVLVDGVLGAALRLGGALALALGALLIAWNRALRREPDAGAWTELSEP